MAYPEAWLKATLEAATTCAAHPRQAPEGYPPPYLVYAREGTERLDLSDASGNPSGTFSVQIYADSYSTVKSLAVLAVAATNNFAGSVDGLDIGLVNVTDESDGDPVYLDGRDIPTYVVDLAYSIQWRD
jgi:hypothetical protein